jgi:PAS domain S-box-containing protein
MGARRGRREVVVAGAPLFAADGALQSFIGTFTDITERKRAEARLRESEERFRATFEQAAVGIGDVGIDGRWLRVNQRLCEMLGYTREELLQRTVDDVSHPDDLVADLATARQMVAGEIAQYSREKRYVRKNGGLLWVNLTASLVRDPGGAPKYFIAVAEDITTRRRAEEALRESEEQLRQAQKMEAIGRLAGGVAHDFNNLLTIIRGRSELLRERVGPASPLRRDIELIEQTAERAAALTHQLLAFSRKQVLQTRLVDLNAVVDEMSVMLRRLIGEDVELVTTLAPGLGLVKADPGQLEQALMNLVVNARDAMPLGGRLTIRTANEWLDAAFARQHWGAPVGRCAMVAVSDTGAGMTPEIQAHIFEPFFTTKERGKGTGLGLATVYGIVEQHSGLIQVESAPARGSTFRIYLPVVDTEPPSPETAAPPARLPRGTETILLVEDEPEVRELVTEILRGHGYRLLAAVDSADALRILDERAETIDLLLTDVVMPGMSGRDLAERVRRSRPQVKVLYMSGYTDDAVGERGVLDPGMVLLQKPFTPRTLLRKLRDVLD